ncbi:hypothetical protein EV121DRAFT_256703 [Schizophyllum commune]
MVRRFRCRICYPCKDEESAASRAAGHCSNSRRCANRVGQDSDSVRLVCSWRIAQLFRGAREKLKTAAGGLNPLTTPIRDGGKRQLRYVCCLAQFVVDRGAASAPLSACRIWTPKYPVSS